MPYQFNPFTGQFDANLDSDKLQGSTWAVPAALGTTTPNRVHATDLTAVALATRKTITSNTIIPADCDAVSVSAPSIQSGVSVDVGANSTWSFLTI